MADEIALTTFTMPASGSVVGTTLDITSPDITEQVKAAILVYSGTTTDDTTEGPGRMGIALIAVDAGDSSTADTAQTTTPMVRDGISSADNRTGGGGVAVALNADTAFGTNFIVRMRVNPSNEVISGGIQLDVTSATTTGQGKGAAILMAGASMRAHIANVTVTTTPQSVTTDGNGAAAGDFEPDLLVVMSGDGLVVGTAAAIDDAIATLGFVVNDGSDTQVCSFINVDDAVNNPTDADGRLDTTHGGACLRSGANRGTLVTVTFGFEATGFTCVTSSDTCRVQVLAIKFDAETLVAVGHKALTGSTGAQSITGIGFAPTVVLGMSTLMAATDTTTDGATASAAGYFVFDDSTSYAVSIHAEEGRTVSGANLTNAGARQGSHAVLTLEHAGSVAQQASLTGMTGDGFDLSFATATAGHLTLLALGLAIAPVVTTETVEISDSALVILNRFLVLAETVQISDAVVLDTMDVSDTGGPAGWTYEARAERGTSLSPGAEAGTVL